MPLLGLSGLCSAGEPFFQVSSGCPITERLEDRLHSEAARALSANLMCRCTLTGADARTIVIGDVSVSGSSAVVHANFEMPARTPPRYVITFVLERDAHGWRIDDTYCGDDRSTTIYSTPIRRCVG